MLNWVGVNTKWQQKYCMTIAWGRNLKPNTLYLSPPRVINHRKHLYFLILCIVFRLSYYAHEESIWAFAFWAKGNHFVVSNYRLNRWILDLSNIQRVLATNSYPAGSLRNTELMLNFSTSYQLLNSSNALAWICLYIIVDVFEIKIDVLLFHNQ